MKKALLFATSLIASIGMCFANESDDIVTIRVTTTSYDATKPPVIAPVKYNKLCPLVITSDDMGRGEFMRNWAYFNGYPVISDSYAGQMDNPLTLLNAPYNAVTLSYQDAGIASDTFEPLTYTDDTGGKRRFTATSAIMPYKIGGAYTLMNQAMAKTMVRTGWSFAQHDVANNFNNVTDVIAYIKEQLPIQSQTMEGITGYGLKIIVEPNGAHSYMTAGKESNEICWNIFQNSTTDYPANSLRLADWTTGTDITSFEQKPAGAFERFFFQGKESTWYEKINTADGSSMILGGTHGIGNSVLQFLKNNVQPTDKYWVASADEVWEYYHLYNNAKIENVSYVGTTLTFDVRMPQYSKHQFRELTINIPGVSHGGSCQFSNNVVTGSARQNESRYTVNFGIESKVSTHIEELITLYRQNLTNQYLKRDAQYLIDMLVDGDAKTNYQNQLDADPNYTISLVAHLGNEKSKQLTSVVTDEQQQTVLPYPRYILDNTTLYQTTANAQTPHYVKVITPNSTNETIDINYTAIDNAEVVFYSEGEELEGTQPITDDINSTNHNLGASLYALELASKGVGGALNKGSVAITTLEPGIYTLVAGIGDTWHDDSHFATFTFKLGDKTICNFTTDASGLKEYVKEDIIVKTGQPLSVSASGTGNARWLDYVYLKKKADYDPLTPEVQLVSTNNSRIKKSDGETQVTLTATAVPPQGGSPISNIVIKDQNGDIIASNNGAECSYIFTSGTLGIYKFSAEGTDNFGRKGVSDELTVSVCSDMSYTVNASTGDELYHVSYSDQTEAKNVIYTYPRHLLKGTVLYEATCNNTNASDVNNENKKTIQPHYGGNIFLSLNNETGPTVQFTKKRENIVYYIEGENIPGIEAKRGSIEDNIGLGGLYWSYFLGSDGAGGHVKSQNTLICNLPAGTYRLTAGIGESWLENPNRIFSFMLNGTEILNAQTQSNKTVEEFTSDCFTVPEDGGNITVSAYYSANARWIDYIYIQKLGKTHIQIASMGYATYSSPYALDFTNSGIKAYKGTIEGNKVVLTDITGIVPSQTGLLLEGTVGEATNTDIPLLTNDQLATDIGSNDLRPHTEDGEVEAGNYVLSGTPDGKELAFRRLASATIVPAGRAYLHGSANARSTLEIAYDNDLTAIDSFSDIPSDQEEMPVYNLQGMKVNKHYRGAIIKKGKLYFIH